MAVIRPVEQLSNAKAVIFDSDGVLVEEGNPLPGAQNLVDHLLNNGKEVIILSNNSTKHPDDMKETYHAKGIRVTEIVNSSVVTAKYCKNQQIQRVYVIGEPGLIEVLQEEGLVYTVNNVDAVIVGMDRDLTYEKLAQATRKIRNGARFIATNPDPSFPTPRGLEPGAGSMIAALETSTDTEPEVIVGKPARFGYEYVLTKYNLEAKDCLMIGDRFETDIVGALNLNIPAIIVNTGIAATREDPGKYQDFPRVPVIENLNNLIGQI